MATSKDDAAIEYLQAKVTALFDDEAAWDADDTDAFVLSAMTDLENAGVSIPTVTDGGGNTLLHAAALWNRPVIMESLIRRGAELNAVNVNGHTPMDLAMHWGHADLGQQLRHYGGKHSCEKERDLSIAQRDLARRQAQESAAELEHASTSLREARHEREALRVERDRIQILYDEIAAQCHKLEATVKLVQSELEQVTLARDSLQVEVDHLVHQLASEKDARENTLSSWKAAEKYVSDLQEQVTAGREREEEALAIRNEAIKDRELARELARQAHLDQGLATHNQRIAERERDKARCELLTAERELAVEKETCRKQLARVEIERRNIQVEIDRQTQILRNENAKLEKSMRTLTVTSSKQREEIERDQLVIRELQTHSGRMAGERDDALAVCATLQQRVENLESERRDAHRTYRDRMDTKLQQQYASDALTGLKAVNCIWKALLTQVRQLQSINDDSTRHQGGCDSSSPGKGPCKSPGRGLAWSTSSELLPSMGFRPHSSTGNLSTVNSTSSRFRTTLLPLLHEISDSTDRAQTKRDADEKSHSPKQSQAKSIPTESNGSSIGSMIFDPGLETEISSRLATLEAVISSGTLTVGEVIAYLQYLASFVDTFLTTLVAWIVDSVRIYRKQTDAQEKMIERKDELIRRFNQHRLESKKQSPAKFRECSVRPLL